MNASDLSVALSDGACLTDSIGSASDLKAVLTERLSRYFARRGLSDEFVSEAASLEDVQLKTASEALAVIQRVQSIIDVEETSGVDQPPLVGTRDLIELRTLLSIAFKWGITPLLARAVLVLPQKLPAPGTSGIVNLTHASKSFALLSSLTSDLLHLIFPSTQGRISQTLITTTILERHAMDLLKPSMTLGWLPRSLSSESYPVLDIARPLAMRFLNFLSPLQTITALGGILSSTPPPLQYVRKLCITLLGQQLLRPQGVQGLCTAVFGEDEAAHDVSVDKLQHIARVFMTVPTSVKPNDYFCKVIPNIISLLSPQERAVYKHAAAFTISRMLSVEDTHTNRDLMSTTAFSILHRPFKDLSSKPVGAQIGRTGPSNTPNPQDSPPTVSMALTTLITLISNADPSPTLISSLLSPVVPTLYSLLHHMDRVKTANPTLRESLYGLLMTWAKIVAGPEGVSILWSTLESNDPGWIIDLEGNMQPGNLSDRDSRLSLLTPQDLNANDGSLNMDENILDLYPNPTHFVQFLKSMERTDISSDMFVKLLEMYRNHKGRVDEDPLRTILYLQIIMQMQAKLTDGKSTANILCKPTHLLFFVKHVLEASVAPPSDPQVKLSRKGGEKDSLLFSLDQDDGLSDEADSDDDTPGAELVTNNTEMVETAINLLLSILEANEDLSARNQPVLNDIFSFLESLVRDGSDIVSPLAREARMVMTARLASTSSEKHSTLHGGNEESAHDIYQKALKLLQDPILPVRAHGLLLLRQLVAPASHGSNDPRLGDDALVPAILSIFLQSVQDDDSYVFLNAVQGLATMVDRFGKDVLRGLLAEYAVGLDGLGMANMTQRDLDVKTRVGEALAAVIRRCGNALSIYVNILVPPLYKILKSRNVPTVLRTSSLSLLADCEGTNPVAMLPYTTDLAQAMISLLQLEVVPAKTKTSALESENPPPTIDTEPLSANQKHPPLRRAALHFLSLLVRETIKECYSSSFGVSILPDSFLRSAKTTVEYVASVDEDDIVRVMAREVGEEIVQLQEAKLGVF